MSEEGGWKSLCYGLMDSLDDLIVNDCLFVVIVKWCLSIVFEKINDNKHLSWDEELLLLPGTSGTLLSANMTFVFQILYLGKSLRKWEKETWLKSNIF